jgi:hypothetical protein
MRSPRVVTLAAVAAGLLALAGCASAAPPVGSEQPEPASSTPAGTVDGDAAEAATYGCTEAQLDHAREFGYPAAVPLDPATLDVPLVAFDVVPDCYLLDEDTGAERYAAFWSEDPAATVARLGEALVSAGYVQSDDYGPYVWWYGGDEPMGAEHAVGAVPQPVGGVEMLWATW